MASSKITLVMPTLNEKENLQWVLPMIKDSYDVLVVDNGSNDGSAEVATSLGVRVIHCREKGYGNAVLAGIDELKNRKVRPEVLVVFDADGTSPVEDIPRVTDPILHGKLDFIIGQRTEMERGAVPWHARFGNWLTVSLIKWSTGQPYQDMGPLRAIRFTSLLELKMIDRTWGWNVEMQMKAKWNNLRIGEIDIKYRNRRYGKSKISGSVIGSIKAGSKIMARIFYFHWHRPKQTSTLELAKKEIPKSSR